MHRVLQPTHLRVGMEVQVLALAGHGPLAGTIAELVETPCRSQWGLSYSRWQVTLATSDGPVSFDAGTAVVTSPEYSEREWCPECRTRREVEERDCGSRMEPWGEVETPYTRLECGHVKHGEREHVVAAAPGAPYAELGRLDQHAARERRAERMDQLGW